MHEETEIWHPDPQRGEPRHALAELEATKVFGRTVSGYAIRWGEKSSDLGGFVETFAPFSMSASIRTTDVVFLWSHDMSMPLARTSAGTLRIKEDRVGLHYECDIPNTTIGRDSLEAVKNGTVANASVRFKNARDSWSILPDGTRLRTVTSCDLIEISLVVWPAYSSTSASIRSIDDGNEPSTYGMSSREKRLAALRRELHREERLRRLNDEISIDRIRALRCN